MLLLGEKILTENCKSKYLMEVIESKGSRQTLFDDLWNLERMTQKVVKFQAKIMNIRVEVINNSTLIFADFVAEIETVVNSGLCFFHNRTIPLSVVIETPGSKNGMSGRAMGEIENAKFSLVNPVTLKLTAVVGWRVLVIKEKECSPCRCQPGFFEKAGTLLLAPSGASAWEEISSFETISFIAYNSGSVTVQLFLEGSPDQINTFNNTPLLELAPQQTNCLVPKFFTRYLRLAGMSPHDAEITYWLQAQF
jgi:hypothetical protein